MKTMDNGVDHSNTYLTTVTIILTVVSKLTLSDAAAGAAIVAAGSTAWLNIYKYRAEKRRERHNNWGKNKPS